MISPTTTSRMDGSPAARLREASKALEGVFIAQLYQAMRKTVPEGGLLDSGTAGDMFTQMFDEHMADTFAQNLTGGLGDRLYEQLRSQFGIQTAAERSGVENG